MKNSNPKPRLYGVAIYKVTRDPIADVLIEITDHRGYLVYTFHTSASGKFEFLMEPNTAYTIRSAKRGCNDAYAFISTQDSVETDTVYKELHMVSLEIGKPIVIEGLEFDFDKHDIRPDAARELDKLVRVLRDNPEINIELGSHTDSRGSDTYNLRLSHHRAHAAMDYIISRGIMSDRLIALGYGETQLTNGCSSGVNCSDEEHKLNNRLVFKVASISR